MEEVEGSFNPIGYVLVFSIVSMFFLFFSMLFFAVLNNYALSELYYLVNDFAIAGLIPVSFIGIADGIASNIGDILPLVDYIWFGAFISMVISTLILSYNRKRGDYFSLLNMLVLGIIIFIYVGSYFIQITDWFMVEVFIRVLPSVSEWTPLFTWYLGNIQVVNLVLIVLNVVANYVDLDFSKFNKRKEDESFGEI